VLASVEAILRPTWPDLPMPLTITRPTAIENQHQRLQEVAVDAVGQCQDGVGFNAQNLAGQIERFREGWIWLMRRQRLSWPRV
jgi:hypothetical protein